MTSSMSSAKQSVARFWEAQACGERYGDEQESVRYALEPEILLVADFPSGKGRQVLEIGVGMGADLLRWATHGAHVTGVDLTQRAVSLTRARLAEQGLSGDVRQADAEALPFANASFDIVWSWGVLHHTPDADGALIEAARVLRPGGRYAVMVYHRRSWLALAAWAKWGLLRLRPRTTLAQAVAHVESPGTKAYTTSEIRELLEPHLKGLHVRPLLTRWDRRVAPGVSHVFGDRFGWFLIIEGVKR